MANRINREALIAFQELSANHFHQQKLLYRVLAISYRSFNYFRIAIGNIWIKFELTYFTTGNHSFSHETFLKILRNLKPKTVKLWLKETNGTQLLDILPFKTSKP